MKKFKKSTALLMAFVMLVGIVSAAGINAFATAADSVWVGGVELKDGEYLVNDAAVKEEPADGKYDAYYHAGELCLYSFNYSGEGYNYGTGRAIIYSDSALKVYVYDGLTLTSTGANVTGIRAEGDLEVSNYSNVTITTSYICVSAAGSMRLKWGSYKLDSYDNNALYSYDDMSLECADVTATSGLDMNTFKVTNGDFMVAGGGLDAVVANTTEGDETCCVIGAANAEFYDVKVMAATDPAGTLVEYADADRNTYDRVCIEKYDLYVAGIAMKDGDYLLNGATETVEKTDLEEGFAYFKDGVLTLNNYMYDGKGAIYAFSSEEPSKSERAQIVADKALKINLVGDNFLGTTDNYTDAGIVAMDQETAIVIEGEGTLSLEKFVKAGIVGEASDVTINSGTLSIKDSAYSIAACGVIINNGEVNIELSAGERAIFSKNINIDKLLNTKASTAIGGELVKYAVADNDTYKYVVVGPHVCEGKLVERKECDCVTDGHEAYYECICGKYYLDEVCSEEIEDLAAWLAGDGNIPKTGHNLVVKAEKVEATCEVNGSEVLLECINDGCDYTEGGEVIPAPGHDWDKWSTNNDDHWSVCHCSAIGKKGAHTDVNKDDSCDTCGFNLYYIHTNAREVRNVGILLSQCDEDRVTIFWEDDINSILAKIEALLASGALTSADKDKLEDYRIQTEKLLVIINNVEDYEFMRFMYCIYDFFNYSINIVFGGIFGAIRSFVSL